MSVETAPAPMPAARVGAIPVLSVTGAVKAFGTVEALRGASLELRAGELLALLGPNGAGKTTLIRAITGRVRLEAGTVALDGRDAPPAERRRALGVVPQEIALYPLLTARENLDAFARLHGVAPADVRARVDEALAWTGLVERSREPVQRFSGGMKRRLNLACGVLHAPRVVLLDEPTVGVDPQSRERIDDMLASLRARGVSMLLTTHQLDEAEDRCDRIAVLDGGRVIATGTPAELIASTVGTQRELALTLDGPLEALPGFDVVLAGARLDARVTDVGVELPLLLAAIGRAGRQVRDLEVRRPTLQAAFLALTGKELRE